jgi:ubiquitin-protein ligase E3 C
MHKNVLCDDLLSDDCCCCIHAYFETQINVVVRPCVEEAFDPVKTGLFVETPDRTLYPNPASFHRAGPDHLRKLEFLGAMLGKAVYEGILVDLPLAGFFLAKLRDGRPPELNDLATLDPELFRHLLSLKRYPADQVKDLFLFFTATDQSRGGGGEGGDGATVGLCSAR